MDADCSEIGIWRQTERNLEVITLNRVKVWADMMS